MARRERISPKPNSYPPKQELPLCLSVSLSLSTFHFVVVEKFKPILLSSEEGGGEGD